MIAPDLLGHGESATPRGDYSLGAHASGARDVATALGHERVTVVGHSLGGGIAMQFAYQFPERTERLVLVSSGGLGRDVHLLLRAASLPGADYRAARADLAAAGRSSGAASAACSASVGLRPGGRHRACSRAASPSSTTPARARRSCTRCGRSSSPAARASARTSRLALAASLPSLIVWGENDSIIPVAHGAAAHEAMPGSRFVVFEGAGHMPQEDQPHHFAAVLGEFCDATEPARLTHDHWQPLLEGKS